MQTEKMKKSRKKLSDADFRRLYQANEILLFTLSFLNDAIAQATETTFALGKYDLRTRLEMIRTTFLLYIEKAEQKLGAIDPTLADHFREVINKNREIVDNSKNKEAKEKRKDKENISPTPPIREKENKIEKEETTTTTISRARARVGEIALRTPSLCTATWHPTLEEVTIWADFHIFKGKEEAEWLKMWYEQMEEVYEWRNDKTGGLINWKSTLRAWWYRELQKRKYNEIDNLRAETAKLYNEKAKQKPKIITAAQRAPNYLPHNQNQKIGFFR